MTDISIPERVKLSEYFLRNISPEVIEKALIDIRAKDEPPTPPPIEFIEAKVCEYLNVAVEELESKCRKGPLAYARLVFTRVVESIYHGDKDIRREVGRRINRSRFMVTKYLDNENKMYIANLSCRNDITYLSTVIYADFEQSEGA